MKLAISQILIAYINASQNQDYEGKIKIARSVLGLSRNWPNLSVEEKQEIAAVAFSIFQTVMHYNLESTLGKYPDFENLTYFNHSDSAIKVKCQINSGQ